MDGGKTVVHIGSGEKSREREREKSDNNKLLGLLCHIVTLPSFIFLSQLLFLWLLQNIHRHHNQIIHFFWLDLRGQNADDISVLLRDFRNRKLSLNMMTINKQTNKLLSSPMSVKR